MKYIANYKKLKNSANDFKKVSKSTSAYAQRLNNVKVELGKFSDFQNIQNSVDACAKAVSSASSAIANSGICLDSICLIYMEAENKTNFFTKITGWLKNLFDKIMWLGFTKPEPQPLPPQPISYTQEEEKEADMKMRGEALILLKEYESKWRSSKNEDEKKFILTDYLANLQKITGTKALAEISFVSLGKGTYGSYNHYKRRISINKDIINTPEGISLLRTVVHEVRHAYQNETVINGINHPVSDETKQIWRENIRHYKSISVFGYDAYYNQPIEADAFWFSGLRNSK